MRPSRLPLLLFLTTYWGSVGRAHGQNCADTNDPFKEARPASKDKKLAEALQQRCKEANGPFTEAEAALRDKEFAKALKGYREAYELCPNYSPVQYGEAMALRGMGRTAKALRKLKCFQVAAQRLKDATKEAKKSASIQISDLKRDVGWVRVQCDQVGAVISVDGDTEGVTPLEEPIPVDPGYHNITVEWQGDEDGDSLSVRAGEVADVKVEFGKDAKSKDRTPVDKASSPLGGKKAVEANGGTRAPPASLPTILPVKPITAPSPRRIDVASEPLDCLEWEEYDCKRPSSCTYGRCELLCDRRCLSWGHRSSVPGIVTMTVAAGVAVAILSYFCYKGFCRSNQYPSNSMGTQAIGH